MAPSAIDSSPEKGTLTQLNPLKGQRRAPLALSGALDKFESFDLTPVIGREFRSVDLVEWLDAPNSDDLIRDLAITISQRGVVFFRAQDRLTNDLQKQLILRLGELTGRPSTSGLHIHPILNPERELGGDDPKISTISSVQDSKLYKKPSNGQVYRKQSSAQWHSDIAFEPVPADYTSLRLVKLPRTGGGDTLWASGYEIYDRISEPYQKFLESLTVTFQQLEFQDIARRQGFQLYEKPRGAAENVGSELKAIHPVVRTNPVTGWKSVFPVGDHVQYINGVTKEESKALLGWFLDLVYKNHDLQVRFKWENPNDFGKFCAPSDYLRCHTNSFAAAIWDNRSTFHTATYDYDESSERFGNRAVGLGERPYLDPASTSRREALGKPLEVTPWY